MPYITTKPELETHLRIHCAHRDLWLRTVRLVSGCDISGCEPHQSTGPTGCLSELITTAGTIIGLHTSQGVDITQCRAPNEFLLFPTAGDVSIASSDGIWRAVDMPLQVGAGNIFNLRLAENSRVVILGPLGKQPSVNSSFERLPELTGLIKGYLDNIRFYIDEAHALALTGDLFDQLADYQAGCLAPSASELATPDRRLIRTIEKIEQDSGWEFNLQELASHSGASERNVYYLMKHNTGMTPYRFYQRQRLIRVRRRLVDCREGEPHISRYAADEGFSHLGRFSALYREHFGELPSETVRWRQRVLEIDAGAGQPPRDVELVPG
ncbi:Helix-turn-helix domain-containing protein [Marinobacter antarcticus]|uniref:Helix-turn-helix domain-containing protein n=1 Tax=Marinobacter antarcticus TaxID=564117 RepID=A0A1M6QLC0_9GAMM|nr:Helix-turn-helix domain-containing protein [Marinobacter antarcticus]